jgi:hypothetical protein
MRRRSLPLSCDDDVRDDDGDGDGDDVRDGGGDGDDRSISALTNINCFLDRFCDADVITSFASQSSNYDCCDADEWGCCSPISTDDPDWVDASVVQMGRGVPAAVSTVGVAVADKQRNSFADFYVAGRYH